MNGVLHILCIYCGICFFPHYTENHYTVQPPYGFNALSILLGFNHKTVNFFRSYTHQLDWTTKLVFTLFIHLSALATHLIPGSYLDVFLLNMDHRCLSFLWSSNLAITVWLKLTQIHLGSDAMILSAGLTKMISRYWMLSTTPAIGHRVLCSSLG